MRKEKKTTGNFEEAEQEEKKWQNVNPAVRLKDIGVKEGGADI
jgi:hypothetical protein